MAERFTREQAQVSVVVDGQAHQGWLQSEVELSLERISGTFNIPMSLLPGTAPPIKRQQKVQVYVGSTVVITGYVLSAEPFYRRDECGLRVMGRDRTGDLVHCSAIHQGGQWRQARLDRIARDLVGPFGLEVVVEADIGEAIADFKLSHGETVLDALARAARVRGVVVTRDHAGRVVLTKAGAKTFAGVIQRGSNVIAMDGIGTDDNRHSEYLAYGQRNTVDDFDTARGMKARAVDAEMRRYLPLVINAHGNVTQAELQTLVDHTARVRRGHSMGVRYMVEGWTWQGQPWPLNHRVTVLDDVAGIEGDQWLIASVRHTCDLREGDVTELVLRPVEAYDTAPLTTQVKRRNWGSKGNTTSNQRGPTDRARN